MSNLGYPARPKSGWAMLAFLALPLALRPTPARSQAPVRHLYTVPPPGASLQFPVRNGPATDDYLDLERQCGVGTPLPDYDLMDPSGRRFSTASLRGQVVVVDFWETSCVPCLREMPHLARLAAAYRRRGVAFIAVCDYLEDEATFRRLAARFGTADLHVLLDPAAGRPGGNPAARSGLRELLRNGFGFPSQDIVSRSGQVAGVLEGYDEHGPEMDLLRQSVDTALRLGVTSHSAARVGSL